MLLVLAGLLALSLAAFLAGWLPYPLGWLVLSLLIGARATQLNRPGRHREGE